MNRLKEIEERLAVIRGEVDSDKPDLNLDDLEKEINDLTEERKKIQGDIEQRKKLRKRVADLPGATVIEEFEDGDGEVEKRFNADSKEYRNAFLKTLLNEKLSEVEERAFVHTTENTDAVIPTELQNKIYSNMEEAHPILADVQILRTGAVISIVKHTAIVAGDAKQVAEGEANDDEQNTFVNVTLSGKDFSKHVDFSYRLGKMAIPAFEQYLVKEIGDRIGAAMAEDIIAQIKGDLAVDNKSDTDGVLTLDHVLAGLGALKQTGRVFVYANNATFYGDIAKLEGAEGLLSFIPNYQEAISGQLLGKGIKEEDALAEGEILILDPNQFVYNVVQDIMLERDKNIKTHVHTIAGFAIAEGSMTNDKAGALITVTPGA